MSGLITAAAVSAVGIGVGAYESNQSQNIAKGQLASENTQLGMEQTQFGEQQVYAQQLNALMANPSSVTSTPGYQFNLDQGLNNTTRQMAAGGFLNSGNQAAALTQYGEGYAMNTFNQQAQLLSQLAGFNAPAYGSNSTGAANAATNANNSAFNNTGQLLASLGFLTAGGGYGNGSPNWGITPDTPNTGSGAISGGMSSIFAGSGYTF